MPSIAARPWTRSRNGIRSWRSGRARRSPSSSGCGAGASADDGAGRRVGRRGGAGPAASTDRVAGPEHHRAPVRPGPRGRPGGGDRLLRRAARGRAREGADRRREESRPREDPRARSRPRRRQYRGEPARGHRSPPRVVDPRLGRVPAHGRRGYRVHRGAGRADGRGAARASADAGAGVAPRSRAERERAAAAGGGVLSDLARPVHDDQRRHLYPRHAAAVRRPEHLRWTPGALPDGDAGRGRRASTGGHPAPRRAVPLSPGARRGFHELLGGSGGPRRADSPRGREALLLARASNRGGPAHGAGADRGERYFFLRGKIQSSQGAAADMNRPGIATPATRPTIPRKMSEMSVLHASSSRAMNPPVHSTSRTISISTGMFTGSPAIPTAERACLPMASPNTSTIRSEKPLITFGCSPKPSAEFTMPSTLTTRRTLSRLPRFARTVASRESPTSRATW